MVQGHEVTRSYDFTRARYEPQHLSLQNEDDFSPFSSLGLHYSTVPSHLTRGHADALESFISIPVCYANDMILQSCIRWHVRMALKNQYFEPSRIFIIYGGVRKAHVCTVSQSSSHGI